MTIKWNGVIYIDEPVECAKCDRTLTIMAVPIDGKLYGYYCAISLGWQPSVGKNA